MKRYLSLMCSVLLIIFPMTLLAGWQVAKPETAFPREPFFEAGMRPQGMPSSIPAGMPAPVGPSTACANGPGFPTQYAVMGQPAAIYAVSISGSLKENLERIMERYHWRVIWKAPFDYNFDGRVTGSSLPNVIEKILRPFPLQAQMFISNRTIAIIPRQLTGTA